MKSTTESDYRQRRRDPDTAAMGKRVTFQTTRWNLVRSDQDPEVLGTLISTYWKPLYFFVRQRGFDNETAKDIVQEFMTKLLQRRSFKRADPARGRFRTFLLCALENFIKDRARLASRDKRGGGHRLLAIDFARGESDFAAQVGPSETPEMALNRGWARSLWEQSLKELQAEPAHLEAFKLYLVDASYRRISQETGLQEREIGSVLRRLKGQLKHIIVGHIRETVTNESDLAAEVEEFRALLARPGDGRREIA